MDDIHERANRQARETNAMELDTGALAQAAAFGASLGEETDKLNAAIVRAESALAGLKLGVKAGVVLERNDSVGWMQCLSFAKTGGEWRLVVESGLCEEGDQWSSTPLVNTSRETRLAAVEHLPELLDELVGEAAKRIDRVRKATAAVDAFAGAIAKKVKA